MKRVSRRIGLVAVGVSLLSMSAVQAITVRVAAVGVNGVKLAAPVSSINLVGGDLVEAEILVSGWSDELSSVSTWQVGLNNESIINDEPPINCDTIKPLHFDNPPFRPAGAYMDRRSNQAAPGRGICDAASSNAGVSCINAPSACAGECIDGLCAEDAGIMCATATNQCVGGDCIPRPDFMMASGAAICAVQTFANNYVYGCTAFGGAGAIDDGSEFYAGTVLLEVSPGALGTFNLQAVVNPTVTFFLSPSSVEATLDLVPLEMIFDDCGDTGACCTGIGACEVMFPSQCNDLGGVYLGNFTSCGVDSCACPQVVSSVPPNCAIDARYPHVQNENAFPRTGLDSVEITFDSDVAGAMALADIERQITGGFGQPQPISVTDLGGGTIRVDLANLGTGQPTAINNQHYYCLRFCGDDERKVCWGRLPADVNGDGTASPADILELIDGLNGVTAPQGLWQCDSDLSGACNPADILGVIDMLNGAGFAVPWNGETLPFNCPTAP